eukprot:6211414-Pleurochrysis_carterae.AAC.1
MHSAHTVTRVRVHACKRTCLKRHPKVCFAFIDPNCKQNTPAKATAYPCSEAHAEIHEGSSISLRGKHACANVCASKTGEMMALPSGKREQKHAQQFPLYTVLCPPLEQVIEWGDMATIVTVDTRGFARSADYTGPWYRPGAFPGATGLERLLDFIYRICMLSVGTLLRRLVTAISSLLFSMLEFPESHVVCVTTGTGHYPDGNPNSAVGAEFGEGESGSGTEQFEILVDGTGSYTITEYETPGTEAYNKAVGFKERLEQERTSLLIALGLLHFPALNTFERSSFAVAHVSCS